MLFVYNGVSHLNLGKLMKFQISLLLISILSYAIHAETTQPNIFIAISDDQSFPHTSIYGSKIVKTPNFDQIAKEGLLFNSAYCASPGCSPSRAAFLTGRHTWQIEEAGTHASDFKAKYETFPERLKKVGYKTGFCGKGWRPGISTERKGKGNPAGGIYYGKQYVKGFKKFMGEHKKGQPFCFWFGSTDPHRGFKKGSGLEAGKKLKDAKVPSFLPDNDEIRGDLLDYAYEIDRFDRDLGGCLKILKEKGLLENTIVIVTSDNGMAFPRAKANCYDFGIRIPLAIRWGNNIVKPGRILDDLVSHLDVTATIYEITKATPPKAFPISGRSLVSLFNSEKSGMVEADRIIYSARERHSSVRYNSLGYPQRCVRVGKYLYIYNFKTERYPAGAPFKLNSKVETYHDIDGCPTLSWMIQNKDDDSGKLLEASVGFRPAEEMFDVEKDRDCMNNLAQNPEYKGLKEKMNKILMDQLKKDGDPRVTGNGDIWETYRRYSHMRWFPKPEWAKKNPESVPEQKWVEERRPKK